MGIVIGVADGASEAVAPPPAALVVVCSVTDPALGTAADEADAPGDRAAVVATALGDDAAARAAVELLAGTAVLACVQAVSARIAIDRVRIKFHMRKP